MVSWVFSSFKNFLLSSNNRIKRRQERGWTQKAPFSNYKGCGFPSVATGLSWSTPCLTASIPHGQLP